MRMHWSRRAVCGSTNLESRPTQILLVVNKQRSHAWNSRRGSAAASGVVAVVGIPQP